MTLGNFFFSSSGAAAGYQIEQSLRFNSADSAYLNRTPGSAGNRKTWTLSFWFKRGKLGTNQNLFAVSDNYGTPSSANYFYIALATDDKMYVQQVYPTYNTALDFSPQGRVFRDPSAWYHVVLAIDTTQATGSNRQKMWINGELQTLVNGTSGGPTTISQNYDTTVNTTNEHRLGYYRSTYYTDGYLAEVNFIDGSALDHEDFGEFDDNNVWRPIEYAGSYTGQSWYLKFDAADVDGDSSGLGNNWTASAGISTSGTGTDVMSDTPTTNWATFNSTIYSNSQSTYSEGNLKVTSNSAWTALSTIPFPQTGKFYIETTLDGISSGYPTVGIADVTTNFNSGGYNFANSVGLRPRSNDANNPWWFKDGTDVTARISTTTVSAGDIFQCIYDADNNKVWFGINNTYYGLNGSTSTTVSASDIAAGTNPAKTLTAGDTYIFQVCPYASAGATVNFGQRDFAYTPPTGYKALNTANLPAPDIADGSDYFNTVLWTGNGSSSSRTISGVGFQPDFTWIKGRSYNGSGNRLMDAVRGAGQMMQTNNTNAEFDDSANVPSFASDGFTLTTTGTSYNASGQTYVAWNWDAGGSGSSNTSGSITSTVSANPTAGFSIVSYTGNNTSGATWGHGLGVAPDMVIIKHRNSTYNWVVYHTGLSATAPEDNYIALNDTGEIAGSTTIFASTAPTSTTFTVGDLGQVNAVNQPYIAYCFAEVEGYSKFGNYIGNGSSDGPFVFTGHKVAWLLIKNASSASTNWTIIDSARSTYNPAEAYLKPNASQAETNLLDIDMLSNGFKLRGTSGGDHNQSGDTYIFASFAENPFGGSGVSPATAR